METNLTDANGEQGSPSITDVNKNEGVTTIPFNLGNLVDTKPNEESAKTPEEIKAEEEAKKLSEQSSSASSNEQDSNESDEEEFFELEGKKFKLDEKGNALNEDGTIFKSKEDVEASLQNEIPPLIDEVIELNGIQILDEDGNIKKYEDSTQGIIEYTKDVAKQEILNAQKAFFEMFPQAKELALHLENGGTEEEFYKAKTASWKHFQLDTENENQMFELVINDLVTKGHSKEEAEELATIYKDTNKLVEKSKVALENKKSEEIKLEKQKKIDADKQEELREIEEQKQWTLINDTIKKGTLKNITIPEAEKDGFFKYLAVAVTKEGQSQVMLDKAKRDLEFELQLDYLRYKKFDLKSLITNAVKTQKALSLRERIANSKGNTNASGGVKPIQNVNPNDVEISVESLIPNQ